jgi:hypothetical protein
MRKAANIGLRRIGQNSFLTLKINSMKKLIVVAISLSAFLFAGNTLTAQINAGSPGNLGNAGNAGLNASTPANVLKWTKEVLPKMELLSAKLGQIKPDSTKDIETQKKLLKALQTLRSINAKGTRLTTAEARQHDTWFKTTVNSFSIECQSHNGNVCCMDCQNHGILGVWCFANCFVARFPGID